jgi:sulfite exporter TauE/SafE
MNHPQQLANHPNTALKKSMIEPLGFVAAFLLGLTSSGHCLGMCGGLTAAMGLAIGTSKRTAYLLSSFHLGRICSYILLGALIGVVTSAGIEWWPELGKWLRLVAGLLLIAMGCYLTGLWKGLAKLERFGQVLWRKLEPLTQKLIPVNTAGKALSLGLLWSGLPCGLIYSTLAWSATASDWQTSALLMGVFGLGTLPALLASSVWAAQLTKLMRSQFANTVIAIALIGFGSWTIYSANLHTGINHSPHLMEDHSGH